MGRPKLIAIDLDGTLLVNHIHLSQQNIDAVQRANEKGIIVCLVSGRTLYGMKTTAEKLGLNSPMISLNGSFIFDPLRNETIFSKTMPREFAHRVIEIFKHLNIYIGYHSGLDWYVDKDCDEMRGEAHSINRPPIVVNDLLSASIPAPHKILAMDFNNESLLREGYQTLIHQLPELNAHFSETFALEIFDGQVSKGNALKHFVSEIGFSNKDVMVIGDNFNDISMMEFAGLSVAMGNAPKEVQAHADWIVPSNVENGVAYAIERALNS